MSGCLFCKCVLGLCNSCSDELFGRPETDLWAFVSGRLQLRSSPLRPFPRVLLCPLSIPKVTIVHGVGCSLNLNISYHCSSVSWEYRQRLVEYGQAIDPQNLPLSGHPLLQKARTFGLGTPRPPLNKHNKLQHTVPSHIKSCTAHWGWEGGPRQKARLFVTEGIWQRKPRFNKQGLYA